MKRRKPDVRECFERLVVHPIIYVFLCMEDTVWFGNPLTCNINYGALVKKVGDMELCTLLQIRGNFECFISFSWFRI